MRNRIFAVLAIAVLAGGGLAYGTYNLMQNQPTKTVNAPTQPVVIAAQSRTTQQTDTTSKVILSNVQVVTAGTRMEQDQDKNKPVQVTVVTLLVYPEQAERLALASNEGKIQLALRNPLDVSAPET